MRVVRANERADEPKALRLDFYHFFPFSMSREVDFRESWEGSSRITEAVVAAAVMIMVAVVSAVTSVVRWDSHVKRSFFPV